MLLSIIINHWKTPELLKSCTGAIQRHIDGINAEIIVADSEATAETQEMVEVLFPNVTHLAFKKNVGFSHSVNAGLKKSRGEYLFIMNADILAQRENIFPKMIQYLKDHPDVGLIGPKLLNPDGTWQQSCFRFYAPLTLLARRTFFGKLPSGKHILHRFFMKDILANITYPPSDSLPVDWLTGAALFTRRSAVEKVGLFDERFFLYFEDVDWCRRFWETGLKVIFFPQVSLYHKHARASNQRGGLLDLLTSRYARVHLMSALQYFHKYKWSTPSYGL